MPQVGSKHFPYTKAGYAAAAKAKKGRGFNDGGTTKLTEELTEEDLKKLEEIIEEQNKKNRRAPKPPPPPTAHTRAMGERSDEDLVEAINETSGLKRGGKVGGTRRNHKGCGCVMEGRRKKTLYVGE